MMCAPAIDPLTQRWRTCFGELVCPTAPTSAAGYVPTHFAAALMESPEERERQEATTLLGRLGTPEDMAAAIAYLASSDAAYVTAETLVIAGGMHSRL